MDALRQLGDRARIGHVGLHDGELIAAETRDDIGVAHAALQPAGHGFEQLVAALVAQRVVDALELVEVEKQHRKLLAAADPLERMIQLLAEKHAVGQTGQRVVMRKPRDPRLGLFALGDVFDHADHILRFAGIVADD